MYNVQTDQGVYYNSKYAAVPDGMQNHRVVSLHFLADILLALMGPFQKCNCAMGATAP